MFSFSQDRVSFVNGYKYLRQDRRNIHQTYIRYGFRMFPKGSGFLTVPETLGLRIPSDVRIGRKGYDSLTWRFKSVFSHSTFFSLLAV